VHPDRFLERRIVFSGLMQVLAAMEITTMRFEGWPVPPAQNDAEKRKGSH